MSVRWEEEEEEEGGGCDDVYALTWLRLLLPPNAAHSLCDFCDSVCLCDG